MSQDLPSPILFSDNEIDPTTSSQNTSYLYYNQGVDNAMFDGQIQCSCSCCLDRLPPRHSCKCTNNTIN